MGCEGEMTGRLVRGGFKFGDWPRISFALKKVNGKE